MPRDHYDRPPTDTTEDRSPTYLDDLAAFIADVSGEQVTVSEKNVIVSAAAVRALQEPNA